MKSLLRSLAALALLATSSLAWSAPALLSAGELDALRASPDVRIVDIRSPDAYVEGHIPAAVSAPYAQWRGPADNPGKLPSVEDLTALVQSLGIDEHSHAVVVSSGADSTDFGAMARVYWTLKYLGLHELSVLNGGVQAWTDAGLPLDQDRPEISPSDFDAQLDESIIVTTAEVASRVGDGNSLLVDARPHDFFVGKNKAPTARVPGTIKGAINVENSRWFKPGTSIFVTPDEARKIAAELLPEDASKETISFCNTGHWAATDWFALSEVVGRDNIRLYPESLAEWSQDNSLPMEHVPGRGSQILNKLKGALG